MTKTELIKQVADQTGIDQNDVKLTLEAILNTVMKALENGEDVHVRNFGRFYLKYRREKKGRDLKNKVEVIIPSHHIPFFDSSKEFKERVKNIRQPIKPA